jgi:hypothetical protein
MLVVPDRGDRAPGESGQLGPGEICAFAASAEFGAGCDSLRSHSILRFGGTIKFVSAGNGDADSEVEPSRRSPDPEVAIGSE